MTENGCREISKLPSAKPSCTTTHILQILAFAAAESEAIRRALLDADILALLLLVMRDNSGNSSILLGSEVTTTLLSRGTRVALLLSIYDDRNSAGDQLSAIVNILLLEGDSEYEDFLNALIMTLL